MKFRSYKSITALLTLFALFNLISLKPVYAFDKSRFFTFFLFASGVGSSAAGAIIRSQANETYDRYLHTADQNEMDSLINDYEKKHNQSLIASRAGIGIVIGAVLISLIDASKIPQPTEQSAPAVFGFEPKNADKQTVNVNFQDNEMILSLNQKF